MSTLTIQLPESLKKTIEALAAREGYSVSHLRSPAGVSRESRVRDGRNSLAAGQGETTRLLTGLVGAAAEPHLGPRDRLSALAFAGP
jgi:hypothetical protein